MLIDLAPEPASGPRHERASMLRGAHPTAGVADSFGSVLARLEPEKSAVIPLTDDAKFDDTEALAPPSKSASDASSGSEDEVQAEGEGEAELHILEPQESYLGVDSETAPMDRFPVISPGTGEAKPLPSHEGLRPAQAQSRGGGVSANAAPNHAPPDATVSSEKAEEGGPRARDRSGAEVHAGGEGRRGDSSAPQAVAVGGESRATDRLQSAPPPVPEPVVRAALASSASEGLLGVRLAVSQSSELWLHGGSVVRGFEGGVSAFALSLGDSAAPATITDALGERLMRPATAAGAELARDIAQQIGARITPLARGQFELMLSPAELGRVEISLREVEGVLTLSVSAERPETMELIRRHLDQLAQDLRQISQRELSLQLGANGAGGNGAKTATNGQTGTPDQAGSSDREDPAEPRLGLSRDHLDLRL